jgi:hydroxymethylglutaryl-CoA lyase
MGFGGCPMAKNDLTGNMPTENMISYFSSKNIDLGLNQEALKESMRIANEIFTKYR